MSATSPVLTLGAYVNPTASTLIIRRHFLLVTRESYNSSESLSGRPGKNLRDIRGARQLGWRLPLFARRLGGYLRYIFIEADRNCIVTRICTPDTKFFLIALKSG